MRMQARAIAAGIMLLTCTLGRGLASQPSVPPVAATSEAPTAEGIESKLAELNETETAAAEFYNEALARLARAEASAERARQARAEAASAPARLEAIRAELATPPATATPDAPPGATLTQLEQSEAMAIAQLDSARNKVTELQAETTRRQERRSQIPDALAKARQRLADLNSQLQTPLESNGSAAEARRTAQLAERVELTAEIDALEAELASYDARRDLLPARRDREVRRVAEAERLVAAWRTIVSTQRSEEAQEASREAKRLQLEAARRHPVLQAFAEETQRLADQRTEADGIPPKITDASQQAAEMRTAFAALKQRYLSVRQRIEASGLNRATGLLLRREFESLPDTAALRRGLKATQRELEDIEYLLLERQEDRIGSDDISLVTQSLLARIEADSEAQQADLEAVAAELATVRRDVLAQLDNDADRYQEVLVELSLVSEALLEATEAYESLIRERILWVRSIAGDRWATLSDLRDGILWLVEPSAWRRAARHIRDDLTDRFPITLFVLAFWISLIAAARWSKQQLRIAADQVARYRTDAFRHSLTALGCTVLVSLPIPVLLWWAGWILVRPTNQPDAAIAVGEGLQAAAWLLFPLVFIRKACKPAGLAAMHFRWPESAVASIRRHLAWFTPLAVPAMGIMIAFDRHGSEIGSGSLGRLSFTVAMLAFALLLFRLCRPRGPLVTALLGVGQEGWVWKLRYLWFPLLVAVPIALIAMAWLGYFYTAIQLESRIENTFTLILVLVVVNGLLMRWLFLARRRVAVEDARRRREQALVDASAATGDAAKPAESSIAQVDEDKLDLPGISLQTRQLFRTFVWVAAALGLYVVWADVLPALRMLERVEIYPEQRIVDLERRTSLPILEIAPSSDTTASAAPRTANEGPASPTLPGPLSVLEAAESDALAADTGSARDIDAITLADISLALIVLLATLIAFRNLPGLMEIVVLQRLPLDAGSRYALSTVLRYAIAIVGLIAAFGAVDISWSSIQWLAAALTFGLAFGLQEIFANFISGLIILAERPIRIGDTVTVGNVSGDVTRIRMRATTITDWDRKELVIPNKTFITGDVINWTLSDPVLRLTIPVGVSYDGDVRKAEDILLRVASEQPHVLADPKPYVLFNAFGDSTLDFQLRVFIPHISHLITVRHHLHMRIIEAFREADIEIAFPQRDLHIRSIGDLAGLVQKADPADRA